MILSLTNLSVRHPRAIGATLALHDLTLSVEKGEQIALIGPSGAGKTTLLHTLACALKPEQGGFTLLGSDPWQLSSPDRHAMRGRLFLAPQTPPLPPRQRVVSAVLAGLLPQWSVWRAIRSLIKPVEPVAAFKALARLHLQDKLYARVDRLSGGERQRCGIARLLISRAELFLVDEPLSALDPALSLQTLAVLQQEASARGATLLCSLHQVALARAHFPRIVGLRDGHIVFDAARDKVTEAMIDALYRHAGEKIDAINPVSGEEAPNIADFGSQHDDHSTAISALVPAALVPRC
ncbi:phosphonate ABC transporter ATP-binding protein [Glaciimonas sp. PAMC28666]|uniref:phosphonate ABC transporter ATP-binding protein n=1 Tax=Glaciimonas sp. PAMC28666 TaxID=2807626 RepID=UPI001962D9C2|nr:ATP-binding cassette domain-containing protein [Glaciimonas sp. PAMC28666]QRX81892.1 ATP-binding cassette domain-containing protein [Glaciimonas sp. PAMC28666]